MDKLQIFQNSEFGEIRVLFKDNLEWFNTLDLCFILEYKNSRDAVKRHVDEEDVVKHDTLSNGGNQQMLYVNESGLYSLIFGSKLESAKKFKRWITSEVLPSLRKTGSYSIGQTSKELELKEKEIQLKTAEFLNNMADSILIHEYKILNAHATKVLTGDFLLLLPAAGEITYSATEIGKMLGISANMVGRLTKKHNLRIEEYGKVFYDKSKYSSKEVETFRYYIKVVDILKNIVSTLASSRTF